jgi:cell division protein FtsL
VRKGITVDLSLVALVVAVAMFLVTLLVIYSMNAQITQLEKSVQLMGKNLEGLKVQVQTLQTQLQQLIKYSPLFNG